MHNNNNAVPAMGASWPEPRVRALQVEEIYRFAPTATAFSYFGALITLGVLIEIGHDDPRLTPIGRRDRRATHDGETGPDDISGQIIQRRVG